MLGERIKLARLKAGYSLRDLAAAMGGQVSAQAISKYENNQMVPGSSTLIALSRALKVSVLYLLNSQGIELIGVDFRAKASITKADQARVQTEVLEWVERYLQIERILEIDSEIWEMPLPELRKPSVVKEAEDLAEEVRVHWNLGHDPIPDLTELLEEWGLKVLVVPLPQRVSGFTCMVQRGSDLTPVPVVVVNKNHTLERRRLTMAHELAHRVIDPELLTPVEEEKFATRFAAAFLIPRQHFTRECGPFRHKLSYRELVNLKHLYKVSGAAVIVRMRDLSIISDSTLIYAFQSIARKWRSEEPEPIEDDPACGQLEEAKRFERLCYRALAEGLITVGKASELLRRPVAEVETGLRGPAQDNADHHQRQQLPH